MKPSEQREQAFWLWSEYQAAGSLAYLERAVLADAAFLHPPGAEGSLLAHAISARDLPAVELLVRLGADVSAAAERGDSYLHLAIEESEGQAALVEALLRGDPRLETRGLGGRTPLHQAALRGLTDAVRLLVAHGADINACTSVDNATTALMEAVLGGHAATVQTLLSLGADWTLTDQRDIGGRGGGRTALDTAVHYGHAEAAAAIRAWTATHRVPRRRGHPAA